MVTTKAVETGDEALMPYGEGWKPMLHILTPDFRKQVIDRYNYKDLEVSQHFSSIGEVQEENYQSDVSNYSGLDSESEIEDIITNTACQAEEPNTIGGQQIRKLATYTLPDKSVYMAMIKDRKGWILPMGNYQADTKRGRWT